MSAVGMFLKGNKVLWPLLGCVGAGVGGGLLFAGHYLRHNQDVVINKNKSRDPWNQVGQAQNTKMFSYNPDFWKGRVGITDPRMAFLQEIEKKDPDARSKAEQSFLRRAREQNMIQEAHAE